MYSPISNHSNSETVKTEYSDIPILNRKKSVTYSSPLISYHSDSSLYLFRKYSENNNIDFEKSNNFIRKDLFFQNEKKLFSNSDEEENEKNLFDNNSFININNNYSNNIEQDEYNQLKPNSNYYQSYKEYIPSKNRINNSKNNTINSTNNIIKINNNNNNENEVILNQNQIMNLNIINQINFINSNNYHNRPRFNSSKLPEGHLIFPYFNNNIFNNNELNGKKGWYCPYCNNFNYESRIKCNRCKKPKNFLDYKNIKNNDSNVNKNNFEGKIQFSDKEGDWICFNCKNINFAFRKICNRCQLSKIESNNLSKNNFNIYYNINNNFTIVGNN